MSRRLAIIAIPIVVFCVFAELVSLVIYYADTGALYYLHRKSYDVFAETNDRALTREGLHPFFGQTHKPGTPFDVPDSLRGSQPARRVTNNFGFVSPHAYPYSRQNADQFLIGIFGGSVAVWFCQVGAERLIEDLQRDQFFKQKDVVTLCLGHEGYKQPQQLLVLSYFLSIGQQFDMVVNIDGFNDVALASLNDQRGFDISMPSVQHLDPLINLVDRSTLTPDKLESLGQVTRSKARLNSLVGAIQRNRVASINFVLERYYTISSNQYVRELGRFSNLPSNSSDQSVIHVTPRVADRTGASLFEEMARNWSRASMLMGTMLAARTIGYVHVLQPNQYYTTRRFTDEEARVALSQESPFKVSAEQGYPALVAESVSSGLEKAGYFFNGVQIFDAEPAPVYMDNCCHYTRVGNERLADVVAAAILKSKGAWAGTRRRVATEGTEITAP
jgi:hypothetical protein